MVGKGKEPEYVPCSDCGMAYEREYLIADSVTNELLCIHCAYPEEED